MISFGMSEEQELVRDSMREFAAEAIRPIARECDESGVDSRRLLDTAWTPRPDEHPDSRGARRRGGGPLVRDQRDPARGARLRRCRPRDRRLAPSLFANAILDHGTEAQKQALLPLFCGESLHDGHRWRSREPGALADASAPAHGGRAEGRRPSCSRAARRFVVFGDRASHFLVTRKARRRRRPPSSCPGTPPGSRSGRSRRRWACTRSRLTVPRARARRGGIRGAARRTRGR